QPGQGVVFLSGSAEDVVAPEWLALAAAIPRLVAGYLEQPALRIVVGVAAAGRELLERFLHDVLGGFHRRAGRARGIEDAPAKAVPQKTGSHFSASAVGRVEFADQGAGIEVAHGPAFLGLDVRDGGGFRTLATGQTREPGRVSLWLSGWVLGARMS